MDFSNRRPRGPRSFGSRGIRVHKTRSIAPRSPKPFKPMRTSFNYGPKMNSFMNNTMKTIVRQPDFRGIGGHGFKSHGNHGLHRQTGIGLGNSHFTFRYKPPRIGPKPFKSRSFRSPRPPRLKRW